MSIEPKKVVDEQQAQFDEDCGNETVRILRVSMDGFPDLILNSLKSLSDDLEWTFLGEDDMWKEGKDGTQITITIGTMSKAEFDALEAWEV